MDRKQSIDQLYMYDEIWELQKPPFCNDNGYKFELKNVDQIGTAVSFWPKK